MNLMSSGCTPSRSAITCANVVSWPWPVDCVPTASSTLPAGCTVTSTRSCGMPTGVSTIVRDADAAQLAAPLRLAPPRREALPVGGLDHALHVAGEIAAVVEQPAGGAVGQLLARDQILLADARRGPCRAAPRRDRSAAPAPASPRAGRRRGTARSAPCWSPPRGSACASAGCHRPWSRRDRRCSAARRSRSVRRWCRCGRRDRR